MASWSTVLNPLSETIHHYVFLDKENKPLSYAEVVRLWCNNGTEGAAFRQLTTATLSESPFVAFKWETPVVDTARMDRNFEFVTLDSPSLDRRENPNAFGEHFDRSNTNQMTLQFPNIGRNAVMVVPTPVRNEADRQVNHCHLVSFLRSASSTRSDDFWWNVGDAMRKRISNKPVWLSTAGGGVAWLHGRLDDQPKYYGYEPFRSK